MLHNKEQILVQKIGPEFTKYFGVWQCINEEYLLLFITKMDVFDAYSRDT